MFSRSSGGEESERESSTSTLQPLTCSVLPAPPAESPNSNHTELNRALQPNHKRKWKGGTTMDGFGWLNIWIIRIRIRLKCKYGYPHSYSILIWMSYGCIWIRFWELFSIRFHIRIRGISDHICIRKEKLTSETSLNLSLYLIIW